MYLVERGAELAGIAHLLKSSAAGRGEFVVVSGPAGCGKSALLAASSDLARARDMRVLFVGRGAGFGGHTRVDVVGAVRGLVEEATGDSSARELGELAQQMLNLASSAPILLVVDDAHLVDRDSFTLLREVGCRVKDAPLSVLVSNPRNTTPWQNFKEPAPLLHRVRKRRISTGPLTRAGVTDLARLRLGVEPTATLVDELIAVAGGNPFLTQAILDDGAAARGADRNVPVFGSAFTHAVLSWLRVPACAQLVEVVQAMAVFGTSCSLERLSHTVDVEPKRLRDILDGLIASGVVSSQLVLHPRIQEVLLKSADYTTLFQLRSRAAEVLYDDGEPAEDIARQLLMNGSAPQPWAVSILREAAEHAALSNRYEDAIMLLRFASRWCADDGTRTEINAKLVDIGWWLEPSAVSRRLRSLLESARNGCLSSRWLARLARRLAWLGSADEADEVLGLSLASMNETSDNWIELAISDFWISHLFPGMTRATSRRGSEMPPEMFVGGYPWLSSARELPALLVAGKQDTVRLRAEEILQRCRPNPTNLEAVQVALFSLLAAERHGPDRSWLAGLASEPGDETSPPRWRSMLCVADGVVSLWRGELSDAVRSVERALGQLDIQHWGALMGLPRGVMLLAMTEQGRHREVADELLRPMPPSFARSPYGLVYLRARGRHHLATGGLQAALADFRSCGHILGSWGMELPGLVPWRLDVSQTLLLLGERDEARLLAEEHLDLFPATPSRTRGIALRLRAMASPLGRRAAGLREAVTELERSGDALELARTLGALAQTYQQTGELAYGRKTLGRAEKLARRLGCGWALREISAAAASSRTPSDLVSHHIESGRTPTPTPSLTSTSSSWGATYPDLSAAEGKVADLAAQGFTNREIADALYVTVSTVEQHLTHIYRKLNIRGRAQLAGLVGSM
ncbi:helix-turn-helix transcriptional regulator [Streptomyces botrytidirepellens]|uniref:helix-turn-helix transcriptional regulator n=1 Tax=Streptomyces botrytidirepellens TaxID=2486417 RepID=UPI00162181E8|nr:LuxR family transcriptional regulator [Streptomyces botrytidirepellens]